jgi:hypothetical protein
MERATSIWRFLITDRRHFWKDVFLTPLHWLFLCFFQPENFSKQFEYRTVAKRCVLLAKLAIPLFLLVFLVALPVQSLFTCTAFCTLSPIFIWNMLSSIFLAALLGIICGLVIGGVDNVGLGIILSIALGVTGIVLGHAARGEARGIAFAIIAGLVSGTAKGVQWRIWRGMLAAILSGLPWIIVSISVTSVPEGVTRGAVVACIFFGCYMIGYYRALLYLFSGPSGLQAYTASKRNPTTVFLNLHNSSLYSYRSLKF